MKEQAADVVGRLVRITNEISTIGATDYLQNYRHEQQSRES